MKRLKIRTRMTLLYTGMLMLFMIICFAVISIVFMETMNQGARAQIIRDANLLADEIEYDEDKEKWDIDIDDDDLEDVTINNLFSVYGNNDTLITRNHSQNWIEILPKNFDGVRTIDHNDLPWLVYDIVIYDDNQEIGWLRIITPMQTTNQANSELRSIFFWSLLSSLIFSIFCGQWIARRALAPIKRITATAKEIEQGDLSQRINLEYDKDEIGELASAFDSMVDTVEASFQREKQFTSDASHELRTPIAIIMAYAEEGLQSKTIILDEYREICDVIYQKSNEMNQMLSQMLWLARNYEDNDVLQMEALNVSVIVQDIADEMQLQAEQKRICIKTDIQPNVCMQGDLMLFTRMMINLIDNAIKYGHENGFIWITLKQVNQSIDISIRDDGQGMASDELQSIFERFYQSDRSRSNQGFGLGLSMVSAIVKKHGGKIQATSELGVGSTFTLQFVSSDRAINQK